MISNTINPESYFDTFDYSGIIEKLLKDNNIQSDDNFIRRYMQEINKKIEDCKRTFKARDYFKEMPNLDRDFSSYVILANTPFVEVEKREKFKVFMSKKLGADLHDKIREYIFPYADEDKDYFQNNAFIILKFDSYEEAKLAASALTGIDIDKSHKASAATYMDFEKTIVMEDVYIPHEFFSFQELVQWEDSNLTEMIMVKCKDRVHVGKIHYLKKEFQHIHTFPLSCNDIRWSPQGKYLVMNEGNVIKLFGGPNFEMKLNLEYNTKDYNLSNNEKYVITFGGYSSTTQKPIESKAEANQDKSNQQVKENVFIWDLLKNELIRGIAINKDEKFDNFKWSNDSKFFGRIKKDVLIVYESPKMQMIPDSQGRRQPIKDNIKEFFWFPNRNNIITVSERKSGNRIDETILQFFEIPSRKTFPPSPITGLEMVSLEWHKNNTTLAVLCKSQDKNPKWSVKVFEFDNNKLSWRSAHTNLSSGDKVYYSVSIKWIGNDLFIAPKFKDNNLDTMGVCPFRLDRKTLKIDPWPSEKFLKNMKFSHFIPSSNGVHFILACMDPNNSNSYGKMELYAIFDNAINYCRTFEFTNNLENVKWDLGGRLFMVELTRKQAEGVRFFDCEGNLLHDSKDSSIQTVTWRPRHIALLDKNQEEDDIKKNFKNISKLYEEEDSQFLSAIEQIRRAERKKIRETFMTTVNRRRQVWEDLKGEREALRPEVEPVIVEHEFIIEEIIHTHEEMLNVD